MTLKDLCDKIEEKKKEEFWRDTDKIAIYGKYLINETVGDVIRISVGRC